MHIFSPLEVLPICDRHRVPGESGSAPARGDYMTRCRLFPLRGVEFGSGFRLCWGQVYLGWYMHHEPLSVHNCRKPSAAPFLECGWQVPASRVQRFQQRVFPQAQLAAKKEHTTLIDKRAFPCRNPSSLA